MADTRQKWGIVLYLQCVRPKAHDMYPFRVLVQCPSFMDAVAVGAMTKDTFETMYLHTYIESQLSYGCMIGYENENSTFVPSKAPLPLLDAESDPDHEVSATLADCDLRVLAKNTQTHSLSSDDDIVEDELADFVVNYDRVPEDLPDDDYDSEDASA